MSGANTFIRDGELQSDLDAKGFKINNLDPSSLLPFTDDVDANNKVLYALRGLRAGPDLRPDIGAHNTVYVSVRTDGYEGSGAPFDPLDGSTDIKYDAIIDGLRTGTNAVTGEVYGAGPFLVILNEGTFLSKGGNGQTNVGGAKYPDNITLRGQGIYQTTVKLSSEPAEWDNSVLNWMVISALQAGTGGVTIENLTADCNWNGIAHTHGTNKKIGGVSVYGSNNTVRNVRVIGCHGELSTSAEAFGIIFWGIAGVPMVNNFSERNYCEQPAGDYQAGIAVWGADITHLQTNFRGNNDKAKGWFFTGVYNIAFVDGATLDNPTAIGTGVFTDGVTTNGSPTVGSAGFIAADLHKLIASAGIPNPAYIGVVTPGVSIGLSSSATINTPINATATASGLTFAIQRPCFGVYHDTGTAKNIVVNNPTFIHVSGGVQSITASAVTNSWVIDNWHVNGGKIDLCNDTRGRASAIAFNSDASVTNSSVDGTIINYDSTGAGENFAGTQHYSCDWDNVNGLTINNVITSFGALAGTASNLHFNNNRTPTGARIATMQDTDVANIVAAPAAANSTGVTGQIAYDASYFYQCIATNTWKRTAISTW